MVSKRAAAIIAVVIAGLILSAATVLYLKGKQSALAEETGISVTGVELNRRMNVLVGVNITSSLDSTVGIKSASLVKIQSGIAVESTEFKPLRQVEAHSQAYIPIGFSLDPEGADYFLYLVTDRGTAVRHRLSYP
ncbi:MAG: hypothetical protein H5T33_05530 [Candidatus Methanosuratus sp.]|nr:hypothetical protein [Candidatus Methanosuratincola sp.]